MRLWYTRDSNGDRALWTQEPFREDGEWTTGGNGEFLVAADFNFEHEIIDKIIGKGFHGLRKGWKSEVLINCHMISTSSNGEHHERSKQVT